MKSLTKSRKKPLIKKTKNKSMRKKTSNKSIPKNSGDRGNRDDYVIAIPSYKRHEILKKKTLKVLDEYNIPKEKIIVFVANKPEYDLYNKTLDPHTYGKLVIGRKGIKEIRNFMANYFDEGQKIVYMDDDLGKIWECRNDIKPYDKKNNKVFKMLSLKKFIDHAFDLSTRTGYHNWGVYPRDNPYFMKPGGNGGITHISKNKSINKSINNSGNNGNNNRNNNYIENTPISTDLKFLIGFLTGVINNKKAEKRTISDKEDYERTIKYYLKDKGVLRFNNVSCYTRCYKVPGGIQTDRKKEVSDRNANILIKKYPNLVSVNNGRNSPFVEIRLRDKIK